MDSIDLSPRKVKCVISNGRIKKKIGRERLKFVGRE